MSNKFNWPDDTEMSLNRRTVLKTLGGAATATATIGSAPLVSAAAGSYTDESYNGRKYTKYIPSTYDGSESLPLVMMLHGCTQSSDGFRSGTQMNQVAEDKGFIVIYPEETEGINNCWNWFEDAHTVRGNGQAKKLSEGIVGQVERNENIDEDRVYVAGLSAGAYMVPNLIVEYADVFAAGAICSGGMYDVAESQIEGNQVISSRDCSAGSSSDPQVEGEHAYDRMKTYGIDDYDVPTIVFHGTSDSTVTPCNGDEAVEQATETNDLLDDDSDNGSVDYTADRTNSGSGPNLSYTEYIYENTDGEPIVDYYVIDGMGHAWSGGSQSGSYTAPGGPDASQIIWEYFSQWDNSLNDSPNADIQTSSTSVQTGEIVDFDASGSSDSDGSISSYDWDFGDGSTATGARVSHSYSDGGVYDVTLTVTDSEGASGTATVSVTADDPGNDAPSVVINVNPTTVTAGNAVDFDGSQSSDPDGSISSYEWDFTSDGAVDATGAQVSHIYDSQGDRTATLTTTDDDGATSSDTVTITVNRFTGYCGTEYPYVHKNNGRAESQSDGSYAAVGSGDDMGYGGSKVTLKQTAENYYEIVDSCGSGSDGGDSGGNTAPSSSFTTSSTPAQTGETVDFDGSGSSDSDGSISSYDWDFGDGSTATGTTASHSYSSAGDYTVTLTVTDNDGVTDLATMTVTVQSSSFSGYCGSDSNYDHVQANRATTDGSYAYAKGSGENMGLYNTYKTTTLKETSAGHYEIVDSC